MTDDINRDLQRQITELKRDVRELRSQAMLSSSSITRGQQRIAGEMAWLLQGSGKVTGTLFIDGVDGGILDVSGEITGDGEINWDGSIDLKGTLHSYGGGRLATSEAGDLNHSMQIIHEAGVGQVVGFGAPVMIRAWASTALFSQEAVRIERADDQYVYIDDDEVKLGHGEATVTVSETEITLVRGDATVTVSENEIALDRGETRVRMVGKYAELVVEGGGSVKIDDGKVRIAQRNGPGIDLIDGQMYLHGLPTS